MWRRTTIGIGLAVAVLGAIACLPPGGGGSGDESDTGDPPDAQCLAEPTCQPGDRRVRSCPDGGSCYRQSTCGSTITCLRGAGDTGRDGIGCLAYPTCDRGDRKVETCPETGSCYTRTLCNATITCLRGGGDAGTRDTADGGSTPDTGDAGGTCPAASETNPDAGCISVAYCCIHDSTGEKCWYANPCEAPADPGPEWTCGESVCARDAGM